MNQLNIFMSILEIIGTVAFALSGAVVAMHKKMDLVGVTVLGIVTAVGGGMLRDIMTGDVPPAAFKNPKCALIAIVVSVAAFLINSFLVKKQKNTSLLMEENMVLFFSDTAGLAAFTVLGIRYTQNAGGFCNTSLLLFAGVITGVGGGVLRDLFAGDIPSIFRKHIYATASLAGAIAYLALETIVSKTVATLIAVALVILIRSLAAHYKWNLPRTKEN